jgi:hypothetical protein
MNETTKFISEATLILLVACDVTYVVYNLLKFVIGEEFEINDLVKSKL